MLSNSCDNFVYHCNIETLNLFEPELQLINTRPLIKNKLKDLISELKMFKFHPILVLLYEEKDYHKSMHKIYHLPFTW